jgi:hypothetical protein
VRVRRGKEMRENSIYKERDGVDQQKSVRRVVGGSDIAQCLDAAPLLCTRDWAVAILRVNERGGV